MAGNHIFDRVCAQNGMEHRLTKINHPWTNGQVERINRTINDATVKPYHYDNHQQLRRQSYARKLVTVISGGVFG